MADGSSRTVAKLWADVVAIEDSLEIEKAHVDALKQELSTKVQSGQQLLNERQKTRQTTSRWLLDCDDPVLGR